MAFADLVSVLLSKSTMTTDQNIKNWNLGAIDCEQQRGAIDCEQQRAGLMVEIYFYFSLKLPRAFAKVKLLSSRMTNSILQELNVLYIAKF